MQERDKYMKKGGMKGEQKKGRVEGMNIGNRATHR